jgi:hypothetical protein
MNLKASRASWQGPYIWIDLIRVQLIGLVISNIWQVKNCGIVIHSRIHLSVGSRRFYQHLLPLYT